MKKVVAINGSPRKNGNTAALLQNILDGAKSQGAEVELINLVSLSYKGCTSCFACKRKGTEFVGKCAVKDELTPVLEKAMAADAVALGSPIYVGDVTGIMRSFIERFAFMNISYSSKGSWHKVARKNGAFVYTMNVNNLQSKLFFYVYMMNTGILKKFGGYTAQLLATNTYQFDDYSRYDALNFDEAKKRKCRETRFPKDRKKAYKIGQELVTK